MRGQLAGKRILVLEDEYFIATDIARALQQEGATVVGPTGDLARGMELLADSTFDAAVLDVNLGDGLSLPLADRLAELAVPYAFLTGYDTEALPSAYRNTPCLLKPFQTHAIVGCVKHLIAEETASC